MKKKNIADIRRDYNADLLSVTQLPNDPFELFSIWQQEILALNINDPTAFVLSTIDKQGMPDSRVLLLKAILDKKFIFYTNYLSNKASQINNNCHVAMNFYWPTQCKQIRVRGKIEKVERKISEAYFATRPFESQVAAIISKQSQKVDLIQQKSLFDKKTKEWAGKTLTCPESWGGYAVSAVSFEFWHGRQGRLHNRVQYFIKNSQWCKQALAP